MKTFFALALAATLLASCKTSEEEKTAQQFVTEGWQAYLSKSYQTAVDRFNDAITKDAGLVDAYNGAGWSYAKLNQLTTAQAKFASGFSLSLNNREMQAGAAYVYNAQKNYSNSAVLASGVLSAEPNWSFSRDMTVSASDLHLLLAEDYFALASYGACLAQVRSMNATFSFSDADTATTAGQKALADEIERLRPIQ